MTGGENIASRAAGYGMPGMRVNGNDPVEMYAATAQAIARARAGEGPTLLECMTFRFFGHNFGDDDSYIPKDQKAAAMAADPVPAFRARLIAEGIATEEELAVIEAAIEADIDDAVKFAIESPWPDKDDLRHDVFETEIAA